MGPAVMAFWDLFKINWLEIGPISARPWIETVEQWTGCISNWVRKYKTEHQKLVWAKELKGPHLNAWDL